MPTQTTLFTHDWSFALGEPANFRPVKLPHDWLIEDTKNLYQSNIGYYRRSFDASLLPQGWRAVLRFDGVCMDSALAVNGKPAGEWKYGYTAFEHDITPFLQAGENELLLSVNHQSPNSRWYSGAGVYRDVWLKLIPPCHFVSDGVLIRTWQEDGVWRWEVSCETQTGGKPADLRHTLTDADGNPVSDDDICAWDMDDPRLYILRSELWVDDALSDVALTRFGFRHTRFDPDEGFFLNGRRVKFFGACQHHDLGGLGAAVHPDAIRRQLGILKSMGVNAIRTAHNPAADVYLDICDEMGLLVMSELTDMWASPKTRYDYARFFPEWVERDAASWLRRDRRHPSVVMWSVGNEIHDTHADAEKGSAILKRLMALVKRHDPHGHAPATLCSNYMPWENTQICADVIKLIGYNYADSLYAPHHEAHPDWMIYGGETGSTVQSRGVYHFPHRKSILADDDLQCSALGNSSTSWGAKSVEHCILSDLRTPFSLGQFVWTGTDYIGEPTPYHTKNSYFGHIDTAGFPKDSFYLYQAAWTTAPMVHLYPYWDFSPGQMVDVRVCSNAPEAELFLDGESLGRRALNGELSACWQTAYRPGTLRAVAYDDKGGIAAEAMRESFGDAVSLHVECQRFGELVFAEITARDSQNRPVENANHRVCVTVKNGALLAMDNGDSTDFDQYQTDNRRLFGGKLLAIVQAEGEVMPVVQATAVDADIPVRKIELEREGFTFTAKLFPANTTHPAVHWRLTDDGGIDSPLGRLEVSEDGMTATVHPKGDGEIWLRCMANNGKEHPGIISQYPMTITGYGKPFLDPYGFISGGLHNYANREMTNGNERGVATLRDGFSHVGFRDLDFGYYGSDEITIPLFPLSPAPFDFEIWEGMPLEGGEKLLTAHYDKGSHWNTYIETTYTLPRRLKGVTSLCLVFTSKMHVKGFRFTPLNKAFVRLNADDCDQIYGDDFRRTGTAVEGIGNNVTLIFEDMDFGAGGTGGVTLGWRSRRETNSVQLVFDGKDGEQRRMVELPAMPDYGEVTFPLDGRIQGIQRLSLVFLPGCELDLAWLQFHPETHKM